MNAQRTCTRFLSRPRTTTASAAIATFVMLSGGCSSAVSLPGTSEGSFSVVGTEGSNTCGSSVGNGSSWSFTVVMSEDGTTLYIANTDGTDEMSGTLASDKATLTASVTSNADASDAGQGPCDLTTTTTFTITLDSSSSPLSFTGSAVFTYAAATGVSTTTDCTDQLKSAGGTYATLPCTVNYSLAATHK